MNTWLRDLLDEYPTNRSDESIKRLARIFADVDDVTMKKAVDRYIMHNSFFPKVSDLMPYVEAAPYDIQNSVIYYGRWPSAEPVRYSDDYLWQFEAARDPEWGTS